MATIVTRAGKGSALSHNEVDANFTNLNTDKLEANTNITVADATVTGNLTVQGTTTTLNTATLQVEDKNITLNYATGDSSGSADGAGITIQDAVDSSTDATILWDATNDKFTFSHDVAATLSTAAQPNITSVGTLTGFTSTGIDDNATSTAITIDSDENVGIGEPSPANRLHVKETPANGAYSTTTNMDPTTRFHSSEATTGSYTAIQLAANNGNSALGWWNIGSVSTSNNYDNHLVFQTRTGSSSYAERMRIDSSGNVGIGTVDPDSNLHIAGSAAASLRFERNDTTITTGNAIGQIHFEHQETGYAGICATLRVESGNNNGNGEFVFQNGVAGTVTEKMRIDRNGNVGIGTASPAKELAVSLNSTSTTTLGQKGGIELYSPSGTVGNGGEITWSSGSGNTETWCAISGHITGNNATGSFGDLVFATKETDSATSPEERMRIDSSGNVGIGETSPDSFFHIKASGVIQTIESSSTSGASTRYQNGTTSTGFYVGLRANTTGDALIYHGDNKNIEFWTNATLRGKLTNTGNFELTASQCQYVGGFGAKTTGGTLNWNDSTNARSGNGHSLMVGNATNGPGFTSYYHPFSFEYNSKDGTGNMTQFAIPYNDPANQGMWFRSRYSGTWTAWSPVSIGVATTLSGVAASGDIYVGVNAESYVRFQGSTGTKYARFYLESDEDVRFTEGGTITANGNVVAYSTAIASDAKLKDNVETLDGCLDKVCQMRGVSYTWNDQSSKEGVEDIGVIAQEMAEIYPEVVTEVEGLNGRDPHLTVDYARLTAVLINAVKELREEVKELKNGAPV